MFFGTPSKDNTRLSFNKFHVPNKITTCKITKKGKKAFEKYVEDIKNYLSL